MNKLETLIVQIYGEVIRSITGQLFTKDQISQITSHTIGRYLSSFFPEPEKDTKAIERVEEAKNHINQANVIITEMQVDLESQTKQLDLLLTDIAEKKQEAEKYRNLANTNEKKFNAFKDEMSEALRDELTQQSEDGKVLRRLATFSIWIITLILGAGLGAYFKDLVVWINGLII